MYIGATHRGILVFHGSQKAHHMQWYGAVIDFIPVVFENIHVTVSYQEYWLVWPTRIHDMFDAFIDWLWMFSQTRKRRRMKSSNMGYCECIFFCLTWSEEIGSLSRIEHLRFIRNTNLLCLFFFETVNDHILSFIPILIRYIDGETHWLQVGSDEDWLHGQWAAHLSLRGIRTHGEERGINKEIK